MIAKVLPFQHSDKKQTFKLIKKKDPDFSLEKFGDVSKSCVDLIERMLHKDPEHRITIQQALAHRFFDQLDPNRVDSHSDEACSDTSENTMAIEVTGLHNEELKLHDPPTRSGTTKKMGKGQPSQKPKIPLIQDK